MQQLLDLLAPPAAAAAPVVAAAAAPEADAAAAPAASEWRDGPPEAPAPQPRSSQLQRLDRVSASLATGLRRASATALPASPLQRRLQRGGAITKVLDAPRPA